jgi:hypothetical protein
MSQAVRLSPSGPVIANANGGPFNPGPGAQLRLVEATTTCAGSLAIPTVPTQIARVLGGTNFAVNLGVASGGHAPYAGNQYRATVLLDVYNPTTNALAEVQLYLDMSTDNATWREVANNDHLVGFSGTKQIRLDAPLQYGSIYGVGTTDQNLYLRARIGASSNGNVVLVDSAATAGDATNNKGTVLLQLTECF